MPSASIYVPPMLYDALKAEGFQLPDECGDLKLTMPVDGIMQMHYTVNLRPEDVAKIGRALAKVGETSDRAVVFRATAGD